MEQIIKELRDEIKELKRRLEKVEYKKQKETVDGKKKYQKEKARIEEIRVNDPKEYKKLIKRKKERNKRYNEKLKKNIM